MSNVNGSANVLPASGKLGILIPGLGAVATTLIAGVAAVRKGAPAGADHKPAQPFGSLTQMGHIRLGKRTDNRYPKIKDFVPLADLNDIVFGGWDLYEDNVYEAASKARVLEQPLLDSVKAELESIKPMKAVFDRSYVTNLDGPNVKTGASKWDLAQQVIKDIEDFKRQHKLDRVVV